MRSKKFITEEELFLEMDKVMDISEEDEIQMKIAFYENDILAAKEEIKLLKKQLRNLRRG